MVCLVHLLPFRSWSAVTLQTARPSPNMTPDFTFESKVLNDSKYSIARTPKLNCLGYKTQIKINLERLQHSNQFDFPYHFLCKHPCNR